MIVTETAAQDSACKLILVGAKEAEQEERHDDGLIKALNAAADLSPPDDVDMLPEEEDDHAEK